MNTSVLMSDLSDWLPWATYTVDALYALFALLTVLVVAGIVAEMKHKDTPPVATKNNTLAH